MGDVDMSALSFGNAGSPTPTQQQGQQANNQTEGGNQPQGGQQGQTNQANQQVQQNQQGQAQPIATGSSGPQTPEDTSSPWVIFGFDLRRLLPENTISSDTKTNGTNGVSGTQQAPQQQQQQTNAPQKQSSPQSSQASKQEQYADEKTESQRTGTILTVVSVISFLVLLLFGVMTAYTITASPITPNSSLVSYHTTYEEYENMLYEYIPLSDYPSLSTLQLGGDQGRSSLAQIMSSQNLSYVQRKHLMQAGVNQGGQSLITAYSDLNNAKKNNAKFGYFHPELYEIMDGESNVSSIQRSLLSLETIRFATAIKVFSKLDTFIDQFTRNTRISRTQAEELMETIISRAERDISYYLQACYLNPFENSEKCNNINDFDAYYQVIEKNQPFDTTLFKELLTFIDNKLEDTQYPSLMMSFDNFDPKSQKLTFTIVVNSFQDDEVELLRKGILNPHIFIVSNIVNLLKQSTFVLGEYININKLDIKKQEVKVGDTIIRMSSSEMRFDLPLQKDSQREISDYVTSLPTAAEKKPSSQNTAQEDIITNPQDTEIQAPEQEESVEVISEQEQEQVSETTTPAISQNESSVDEITIPDNVPTLSIFGDNNPDPNDALSVDQRKTDDTNATGATIFIP